MKDHSFKIQSDPSKMILRHQEAQTSTMETMVMDMLPVGVAQIACLDPVVQDYLLRQLASNRAFSASDKEYK